MSLRPYQNSSSNPAMKYVMYALYIAIIVAIIIVVVKIFKAVKDTSNVIGDLATYAEVSARTGVNQTRVAYINGLANTLWNQGVNGGTWQPRWTRNYDEEMFIQAINNMQSEAELLLLGQYYQQVSSETLRQAVDASFNSDDINKIVPASNYAIVEKM